MRLLASTTAGLILVAAASPAWAQAGWYVTPSLSLTEEYDDNVFGQSSGRKSDFITRVTVGLSAGYRSVPFTLLGAYSVGAEVYADNSDLNGLANRQEGRLDLSYLPTPVLTLRLNGSYARNETSTVTLQPTGVVAAGGPQPSDTTPGTPAGATAASETASTGTPEAGALAPGAPAVDVGRRRTTVLAASPSASYAFTPRTSADLSYYYGRTRVSEAATGANVPADTAAPDGSTGTTRRGALTDTAHEAGLGLAYQLTAVDRGTVRYRFRRFESEEEAESTTSHVVTLGLSGPLLTQQTHVSLEAGPRFSDGDTGVEASGRLEHRFQIVTVSLAYTRSQGIVAGLSGAQNTDTGSVGLTYQPLREFQVMLSGSVIRAEEEIETGSRDLMIYRAGLNLVYRLTDSMVARAAYSFSLQEEGSETIRHHIVSIGLELAYPIRVY